MYRVARVRMSDLTGSEHDSKRFNSDLAPNNSRFSFSKKVPGNDFDWKNGPNKEIKNRESHPLININSDISRRTLNILLEDKTTGKNIIWATDAYKSHGKNCSDIDQIKQEMFFTGKPIVLVPRAEKASEEQQERTRKKAEVFTPMWLCNKMNNHLDEQWFGTSGTFNSENEDGTWSPTEEKVKFPDEKNWQDYVDSRKIEITCGEAPFLASRYDATEGHSILPIPLRIGILDRKLRIVNENTETEKEWLKWTERAFQSCYGFEWQGDNLLIARFNLLMTFKDYYSAKWGKDPEAEIEEHIANIISWNLWQMDGLKDTVPFGKPYQEHRQMTLFDSFDHSNKSSQEKVALPCKIFNWRSNNSLLFKKCKRDKMGKKMFDFIIGNPPYQMETSELTEGYTNGQTPKKNVFHYFQIFADELSEVSAVLIYPGGRWIQRSGKGLSEFGLKQINDAHVSKIYFYPDTRELFPSAALPDGITIVVKNYKKTSLGFTYYYCEHGQTTEFNLDPPGEEILPLNPKDIPLSKKLKDFVEVHHLKFLQNRILPRSLFGIESDFVHKNGDKVREYTDDASVDFGHEIKLFTNDKAGKSGRAKWFVADKNVIESNADYIDKWKVIVSSANAGGFKRDRQLEIIDNHSAFGRSRVALGVFNTQKEAENFYKYMESTIVRYAFLLSDEALTTLGAKVPDLQDYTDSCKIVDFNKDLDTQLISLIGFTKEQYDYIVETVNSIRE